MMSGNIYDRDIIVFPEPTPEVKPAVPAVKAKKAVPDKEG
jgi:hypothetical protein